MKRRLLLIATAFTALTAAAQNPIPNGDFETWDSTGYVIPRNFVECSNTQSLSNNLPLNELKVADPYHGSYAVQLTTVASAQDTNFGFFINTNPSGNNPASWTGGFAYNQKPTGIRGWYKSAIPAGDTALLFCVFRAGGNPVGGGTVQFYGTHTGYTLFTYTFSPPLLATPDTVIIGATSSDALNSIQIAGSTITLDSISFTGVSSQPALFDGDFENWTTNSIITPHQWYVNTDQNGDGVSRTTDSYTGHYAVELQTFLGQNHDSPAAQAGSISTGYYPNNCDTNCSELGGYSFTNQVDTLIFWYKYVPHGNDTASVNVCVIKNANQIWCDGQFLLASPNWQKAMLYMNIGQTPDTLIVSFQSSSYNDSTLNFIGSDLKIDDVYLASQVNTGVQLLQADNGIKLYPNPATNSVTLEVGSQITLQDMEVRVYNLFGEQVMDLPMTQYKQTINRNGLSAGMYFYEVINSDQVLKQGKLVFE